VIASRARWMERRKRRGMDEEVARPSTPDLSRRMLLRRRPGFDDNVVELFAEELIDYGFMRAADFKKIGQRAIGARLAPSAPGLSRRGRCQWSSCGCE